MASQINRSEVRPADQFQLAILEDDRAVLIERSSGAAYVSISELAHWCEADRQTISTAVKAPPQSLKPLLGAGSSSAVKVQNPLSAEPWAIVPVEQAYDILRSLRHHPKWPHRTRRF